MKKRERAKTKDNVIYLPGLDKRLAEKGLEHLHKKRFSDAIQFLEEARTMNPDDDEILIGLVLAYFEASAFTKAKTLANEMLLKGIGDYFQLVELYLSILIQLHEYREIVTTIEMLFEEKEIPPEKHEHFSTILQFSLRMAENHLPVVDEEEEDPGKLNLFSSQSITEQMLIITSLAEKNIRPYIAEINEFLSSEEGHPFLKTMLLILLKEQEYDRKVMVFKFGHRMEVAPDQLPEIHSQPKMKKITGLLGEILESSNPVLFENIKGMVERISFISFPFDLPPQEAEAWAAAFHLLGEKYFGQDISPLKIAREYEVPVEKIDHASEQITSIEEISYPNL